MARSVITDLLARAGPVPVQDGLPDAEAEAVKAGPGDTHDTHESKESQAEAGTDEVAPFAGSARTATGPCRCRYAGAMLLYPYLHRVGAGAIFTTAPVARPAGAATCR